MADPLKAQPGADDDARIEHLLVTGLDHYFAGEYEQAINLWTRVLFLDRTHDRARAYIDRARSAQAERQRVSEALVHQGLDAFDRGEVARARELLSDALEQGASHDVALGVLGRIDRLDVGHNVARPPVAVRRRVSARPAHADAEPAHRATLARWLATAAAVVLISLIAFVLVSPGGVTDWFPAQATVGAPVQVSTTPGPLPLPAPTETYVAQARSLFAGGKLRDALRALDRVPVGDSLRADADRLRGDIQRELLAVAAAEVSSSAGAPPPPQPQE